MAIKEMNTEVIKSLVLIRVMMNQAAHAVEMAFPLMASQ